MTAGRKQWSLVGLWAALIGLVPSVSMAFAKAAPDVEALVLSYLRVQATERVVAATAEMREGLSAEDAQQVDDAMQAWQGARASLVRDALQRQFGNEAEARFTGFINDFVMAARSGDQGPLGRLCAALAIDPPCADYAALNQAVTERYMEGDVRDSSWLLGNIQRWAELRRAGRPMPPLAMWLSRDVPSPSPSAAPKATAAPTRPAASPGSVEALMAAEAVPQITLPAENVEATASPLAVFQEQWKKKREDLYKDSNAATDQMLTQRKEWEEDYAAQRKSKAEAEAEAFKKHSEELAKADKDALEQQQNGWQSKIKGIVGSLISSSVGAFTGGVGTQAGEKLAQKVFKNDD